MFLAKATDQSLRYRGFESEITGQAALATQHQGIYDNTHLIKRIALQLGG